MALNHSIFTFLNSLAGVSAVFDAVIVFTSEYLGFIIMGGLLLWEWINYKSGRRILARKILMHVLVASLAWGVGTIVKKFIIVSPRPFMVLEDITVLFDHGGNESFPSGHTLFFTALGTSLYFYKKQLGILVLIVAIVVGISRVIAGVHWPLDVLGGLVMGVVVGYLISLGISKTTKRFGFSGFKEG